MRRLAVLLPLFFCVTFAYADNPATSQPTGELDLTFSQRSPRSALKELAKRASLAAAPQNDYELGSCPFKAYVPKNYAPTVPCGIILYLGYKDSTSVPPAWEPVLEAHHLIFITPVCHSGDQFQPSVPLWQTIGLSMDAFYNLSNKYKIDRTRIYVMAFGDSSLQEDVALADGCMGFICVYDLGYYKTVAIPSTGQMMPQTYQFPVGRLFSAAQKRGYVLIDDGSDKLSAAGAAKRAQMLRDGFTAVANLSLPNKDDLHYPNLAADWFEQTALPFLDKSAAAAPNPADAAQSAPATQPNAQAPAPAPAEDAQHLLSMGQLYMSNGETDAAKVQLQKIIDKYPNDPAAEKAKELLDEIGKQ